MSGILTGTLDTRRRFQGTARHAGRGDDSGTSSRIDLQLIGTTARGSLQTRPSYPKRIGVQTRRPGDDRTLQIDSREAGLQPWLAWRSAGGRAVPFGLSSSAALQPDISLGEQPQGRGVKRSLAHRRRGFFCIARPRPRRLESQCRVHRRRGKAGGLRHAECWVVRVRSGGTVAMQKRIANGLL